MSDLTGVRSVARECVDECEQATGCEPLPTELRQGHSAVIVIGGGIGGPVALREFLGAVPDDLAVPILVAQQLPTSFAATLVLDLSRFTRYQVLPARVGDLLTPGQVVLVPADHAPVIATGRIVALTATAANSWLDATMTNVAAACGSGAMGVVFSGLGTAGLAGLQAIRQAGGRTFGQDLASSRVADLPRRAAEAGLLDQVGTPTNLGRVITEIFRLPRT